MFCEELCVTCIIYLRNFHGSKETAINTNAKKENRINAQSNIKEYRIDVKFIKRAKVHNDNKLCLQYIVHSLLQIF